MIKELLLTEERRTLPPMTKGGWALLRRICKKEGLLIPGWDEMKAEKEGEKGP
jgi:hypothetical protein